MNFKNHINKYHYFEIISQIASKTNLDVYIVGGYVRDLILDRERTEIDFLIVGDGLHFAQLLAEKLKVKKVNLFKKFWYCAF